MNLIIIGASRGLGRAISEELAKEKHKLLLVASSKEDLEALAQDLRIKYEQTSQNIQTLNCRLKCTEESINLIRDKAKSFNSKIDGILFPLGLSNEFDTGQLNSNETNNLIESNFSGIVALTQAFLPEMLASDNGILVFFGSIAATRGRSSNIVYSASKRGLESFAESIRHKCAKSKIKVQFYQLGYINTAQTFGKKLLFPVASPEKAAKFIVQKLNKDTGFTYYPSFWKFICLILKYIPWFIFKKIQF